MPHNVTYPNIVYNVLSPNLVYVLPPGHIIWLSYPLTLKLPLLVYLYNYFVEYLYSPLVDLVLSHSTTPKLLLLYLALDYAHVSILLAEDPILSYAHLFKPYIDYNVLY